MCPPQRLSRLCLRYKSLRGSKSLLLPPKRRYPGNFYFWPVSFFADDSLEDIRQCLIYDTPEPNARLVGVEYMISAALYKTLGAEERRLWHSHVFEVKSGMLIMPGPEGLPQGLWEEAETKEMEQVAGFYGKTYHLWQVDRGDKLPLGQPQLMVSFAGEEQLSGFKEMLRERDERFRVDSESKEAKREYITEPEIHGGECLWAIYLISDGMLIHGGRRGRRMEETERRNVENERIVFAEDVRTIGFVKAGKKDSLHSSSSIFDAPTCPLQHPSIQH